MDASPRSRHRRRKSSAHLARLSRSRPRSTPEQIRDFRLNSPRLRLISVWLVLVAGMLGLGSRLAYLQLVIADDLQVIAQEQQAIQATPRTSRRQMVDRQGNVIAMDRVVYTLYVHPMLFKKPSSTIAQSISTVLGLDPKQLTRKFAAEESGIQLSTDISEETAKRLRGLRLDGLDLLPSPKRVYPQSALFSQVTGYIDLEGQPKAGIELALQEQLSYDDPKVGEPTPLQHVTRDDLQMQLTIDSRLQRIAQDNLAKTVAEYGAKRGALLVMDSRTGEILTMAIAPTYDPNKYYDANIEYFRNWAVSDLYEPGSTFKPINVAIALEDKAITATDLVNDAGRIQIGKWPIQNVDYSTNGPRGPISITDVLRYSSNVGMVRIMERLPRANYYEWLEQKLGLGDRTGIDLPGETNGQIKARDQFVGSEVEAATTSFGQGFSLTVLQLAQLHGSLANRGKLVTPHVVRGLTNAEGEITWAPERAAAKQIFSPETTRIVLDMMKDVVNDGTGSAAKLDGYQVAGKTGTAQKATEYGTYGDQRITSFVSIAPVSDPRYVVLAVIDEPQGENAYGGTVAAPLVKKVLESLVVLEGIAPDASSPSSRQQQQQPDANQN
ncbi:MAG: peptidoglycan D,D-transpeptidase FtsI family protein [Phormidesmis sp.]